MMCHVLGDGQPIGAKKGGTDPAIPRFGPGIEKSNIFAADGADLQLLKERGPRSVVEGTNHSGHITHGRTLDAPFADRARWFAFKIHNHKIFAGVEDLAEMVIAVTPNANGVG